MKAKLLITAGMIEIMLLLSSCAALNANRDQQTIEISINQLMNQKHIEKEIEIAEGGTLIVILGSNPSTGFQWSDTAHIGSPNIIEQVKHEYTTKESKTPPPPGTAGQEIWTFKVLRPGTSTISMDYSRPWEGGEKGEWTFKLTVGVK